MAAMVRPFTAADLGSPRVIVKVFKHELVHAFIDRVRRLHALAQIRSGGGSRSRLMQFLVEVG